MVDFITSDCTAPTTLNSFHSGAYGRSSFSTSWRSAVVPDSLDANLGSVPVYLQVLNKFNIPVDTSGGLPPGGYLPGMDIRNMDAVDAIRFSMAESLTQGQWWELHEDAFGGVKFINVFNNGSPSKTITLDVRFCVPSSSVENEVDMVIVRGYQRPPQRHAGDFVDVVPAGTGLINPTSVNGTEKLFTVHLAQEVSSCVKSNLAAYATKSYLSPLLDVTTFGAQDSNKVYNVKAGESIVTYLIDIDGMDDDGRVTYDFKDKTTWYFRPGFPTFNQTSQLTSDCTEGIQTTENTVYYQGDYTYTAPNFTDRYGDPWPLYGAPTAILYTGYNIEQVLSIGAGLASEVSYIFVSPVPQFVSMSAGTQWTVSYKGPRKYNISFYYQPKTTIRVWEFIQAAFSTNRVELKVWESGAFTPISSAAPDAPASVAGAGLLGGVNKFGTLITDMWMGVTLDRPSVAVYDPEGDSLAYAARLRVRYAPLILTQHFKPIAYAARVNNGVGVIVDQTVGIEDDDPTTCQVFDESPLTIMQDLSTGNVVDVTLPFCENENVCKRVAETIYRYQNHSDVQTYTLTCGPDDIPELGAAVSGFSTDLRVESISYSFQDSSSYTIEVTLGPVFSNVGTWDVPDSATKMKDETRQALVRYTAGDGINYRVYVQGIGEYNAINATNYVYVIGQEVTATVYNLPQVQG